MTGQNDVGRPKGGRARRGSRGLRALGETLPRVTRAALGRRGLAEGGLLHDWPDIVGQEIAEVSLPLRLSFPRRDRRTEGTLTLRVAPGHAVLLQHLEPHIQDRVNGYFGYAAVARLRLQQGPLRRPQRKPPVAAARSLTPAAEARLAGRSAEIEDDALRGALERLGRAVLGSSRGNTES